MSEPALFARGKRLKFTAAVWFLGGCGLAGLPPFASSLAEDLVSHANHGRYELASTIFFFLSGLLTAAAVFRVFMRVFLGWGDHGPSDRSSEVDELPETSDENKVIPARIFAPAAICTLSSIGLMFVPSLKALSLGASQRMLAQQNYIADIYAIPHYLPSLIPPESELGSMLIHGFAAVGCALLIAAWSVLHRRIPRVLRWPSHMEGSMRWARQLQSGQPADYVVWAMVGVAALGGAFLIMR